MPPATSHKSYATSRFHVKVDGHALTSYVKSVDGGLYKVESTLDPTGPYHIPVRHISTRAIEPINMELGLSGTGWIMSMLQGVINDRTHKRIDGEILHADANTNIRFRQEFKRALITEIVLPSLDASSKDSAFVKVKIQPEMIDFEAKGPGQKIQTDNETPQKLMGNNAFRLSLEVNGQAICCDQVSKIEAITVKVNAKAVPVGKFHLPQYVPTKMDVSKLSVTLPLDCAGDFINWYRNTVTIEKARRDGPSYEATGSIEFLNQARSKTLYSIDLMGVGPENVVIGKADAGGSAYKNVKVDMYCTQLKVSPGQLGTGY